MKCRSLKCVTFGFLTILLAFARSSPAQPPQPVGSKFILEELPSHVVATMEVRDRYLASLPRASGGSAFLVDDILRWLPGQTVRVAFLGGSDTLHQEIADATRQITQHANIRLDFGFNATTGKFRKWTTNDKAYAAEIRVSFDQDGYFSLVGTDSIGTFIGHANKPVGGRPNQRTLNLGGFQVFRPADFEGIVRHEFLHALAFEHEHQAKSAGCDSEFRWDNDPGYVPTLDESGESLGLDHANRRPGIYTYLAGPPNGWDRAKVDHNLRPMSSTTLTAGSFDQESIMLYRFPDFFYRTQPNSPCAPTGDGINLSKGDVEGLKHLYPFAAAEATSLTDQREGALEILIDAKMTPKLLKQGADLQKSLLSKGKID